jgi:hypothetical protein
MFLLCVSWKWDKNGNPLPQTIAEQHLPALVVKMTNANTCTELKQKEVTTSHKTLGTFKCIVGKEMDQFEYLMDKSDKIVKKVERFQLTQHQAWLAYTCCLIPSMVYSLTAVSLSEKQLTTIQRKATSKFTQLCGFEITFPKAVVHGPIDFGGLGFPHLYAESNICKIETMICHITKKTTPGETFCLNINWIQLLSGISSPVFESDKHLDYIQDNWFLEIKKFLNMCKATIKINSLWSPQLMKINDKFIMDTVNPNTSTKIHRKIINNWRIYFQVNIFCLI